MEEDDRVRPGSRLPFKITIVEPPPRPVMVRAPFGPGYSQDELDDAQERFDLRFPPDLVSFLREHRICRGYDWTRDDEGIRSALEWPYRGLLFDVENGNLWWPEWGERPSAEADRAAVLRAVVGAAPKLIPLQGHRYLPETPSEPGNPVFSVYQSDIIYYGADLEEWAWTDVLGKPAVPNDRKPKWIAFWSEMVVRMRMNTREEGEAYMAHVESLWAASRPANDENPGD